MNVQHMTLRAICGRKSVIASASLCCKRSGNVSKRFGGSGLVGTRHGHKILPFTHAHEHIDTDWTKNGDLKRMVLVSISWSGTFVLAYGQTRCALYPKIKIPAFRFVSAANNNWSPSHGNWKYVGLCPTTKPVRFVYNRRAYQISPCSLNSNVAEYRGANCDLKTP